MKKIFAIVLCFALLMMAACSGGASGAAPASQHDHTAAAWTADHQNHWRECHDCGTEYDKAAHTLEEGTCTVCNSGVEVFEDGMTQLLCYNEQGDTVLWAIYNPEGMAERTDRYEYSYSADGKKLSEKSYSDDVLTAEYEYGVTAEGKQYIVKETYYNEDETRSVSEYDDSENLVYSANYAADGSVEYACVWEFSADNSAMTEKQYEGEKLTAESEYRIDEEGSQSLAKATYYNEDGSSETTEYDEHGNELAYTMLNAEGKVETERRYEHSYNEDGQVILTKNYENGRLTQEMEFIVGSDDEGSWSMSGKTTDYNEDGSKTVRDSDPDGKWSTEITYAADGSVIEELRYEYDYNENGDQTAGRSYRNGVLFEESYIIPDENGETKEVVMIKYNDDGSRRERRYDNNFDLIIEVNYDALGNVVES